LATAAPPATDATIVRQLFEELPKGRMVGASLLCYCMDPTWSRVYFLLGKERKNVRWKLGSERWSDFGGRVCAKAMSAEDTAAKEFVEETLALVKYFQHDTLPRTQWEDIAESLRQGEYTFQLTFGVVDPEDASNTRNYVTFVKQVPWDPEALSRFETCREMMMNPSSYIDSLPWRSYICNNPGMMPGMQVKRDYMEKKVLGLWSIPQVRHAVEYNGVLARKDGKVERCKSSFTGTMELVLSELAFAHPECVHDSAI
jgi:hypothetical protein